jgi:hypothetical protein
MGSLNSVEGHILVSSVLVADAVLAFGNLQVTFLRRVEYRKTARRGCIPLPHLLRGQL